ncbi:DUF7344 domain-containing protein [Halobiforma nitratireducens]|uniref:DUF7344 domain-containing protein n=1 Tax=Halobiforma nitratireducens JCM 10879 TaxID=1227454 RepID=M0LYX4_9EURY|nr:hypothetical protein [Halobiforma nitratireducens]EMA37325.1 hypothetical protein C446_10730 [Halobiforma nitratireducens JCM 10879]
MTGTRPGEPRRSVERWNQVFEALAARPRRRLILTLQEKPADSQVPLPDAAVPSAADREPSSDRDSLVLALKHRHLPLLADWGFVDWTTEPFSVQRGPRFDEVLVVLESLDANANADPARIPDPLSAAFPRSGSAAGREDG